MTEDMINSPSHYTAGGIEPIEVLRAKLTAEQYEGYLLGTALVYMLRANFKGQMALDFEKAEWYSKRLVEHQKETRSLELSSGAVDKTNTDYFLDELKKTAPKMAAEMAEEPALIASYKANESA